MQKLRLGEAEVVVGRKENDCITVIRSRTYTNTRENRRAATLVGSNTQLLSRAAHRSRNVCERARARARVSLCALKK